MCESHRKLVLCLVWLISIAMVTLSSPTTSSLPLSASAIGKESPLDRTLSQSLNSDIKVKNSKDEISGVIESQAKSIAPKGDARAVDGEDKVSHSDSPVDQLTALNSVDDGNQSQTNSLNQEKQTVISQPTVSSGGNLLASNERQAVRDFKPNLPSQAQRYIFDTAAQTKPSLSSDEPSLLAHRIKRSHIRSLHTNLDDLLNIRRQRRALRLKRNTNYDNFLAQVLALKDRDDGDKYDANPILSNDVNLIPVSQALYQLLANRYDRDDDGYVDMDKLSQYYYDNRVPVLEFDSDGSDDDDDGELNQDLPLVIQPYSQQVIPVVPYQLPASRYQRIRRSYYKNYRNPLSVYSGLRRKRTHDAYYGQDLGEWGKIVGDRDEQSSYDDVGDEANKIYSLATLLATENSPDEFAQRYKRSPVTNNINMM